MPSFLPTNNDERISWLQNFKTKFPAIAAANDFTPETIALVLEACETIEFSITLAERAKTFSKVCTTFRNARLKKTGEKTADIPVFTMPAAPPSLTPTNAIGYLQKMVQLLKAQPNYTAAIGKNLLIVTNNARRPAENEAQPKGKIKSLNNSVVRIDWTKKGFVGVIIESKRGDETAYTELSRDLESPFIDVRPPLVAGQPELRSYRLIYIVEDKPYGNPSTIMEAVTIP